MSKALAKGLLMTKALANSIEINDEDQYDFIMRSFSHLSATILMQQVLFNEKFITDKENANDVFDSMRKALDDVRRSVFMLSISIDESRTNA